MSQTSSKIKKKLFSNGSPIIAVILFVAAFILTTSLIRSCTSIKIDRYEFGKELRAIVDGEEGEVVAEINGVQFREKDLLLMIESLKLSEPQYMKLKEEQIRLIAGGMLIEQEMLLMEYDRLGLKMTDEKFTKFVEDQKLTAAQMIQLGGEEADNFQKYISGYGCTYSEYFEDEYVLRSFMRSAKTDEVKLKICTDKGRDSINEDVIDSYLTDLINDGTYKATLFGEEFK